MCGSVLQIVGVRRSVLECVGVCWSALECVAVCCSVLQCVGERFDVSVAQLVDTSIEWSDSQVYCSVLQGVAVYCSVQCFALHCSIAV